jgi:hypothetical protein
MLELAFQADEAAENRRHDQSGDRAADGSARHLPAQNVEEMLPGHEDEGLPEADFRWPDFIIGVAGAKVTCVITGRDI